MPHIYLHTVDGAKIPLAVNANGELVLDPAGNVGISGPVDSHIQGWNGATWENVGLDSATRVLSTVSYEHHEIHGGRSFTCGYTQTVSDTNDRSIITFRTANTTRWLHLVAVATATAIANFIITEAPTVTDDTGAPLTIFNRDRNSANISGVWDTSQNPDVQGQATFFTEVTMGNVTGGTDIYTETIGGATGPASRTQAGESRGVSEWILKPNTLYAIEVISLDDADNIHHIILNWYEHVNK